MDAINNSSESKWSSSCPVVYRQEKKNKYKIAHFVHIFTRKKRGWAGEGGQCAISVIYSITEQYVLHSMYDNTEQTADTV